MAERKTTTKPKTKTRTTKSTRATKTTAAKKQPAKVVVAAVTQDKLKNSHINGFTTFIREQGVVGLAVGLAIGTAAGDTVKKLVEGFISPVVQFIVGSQKGLESSVAHVEIAGRSADFAWGAFVSSFITLVATAFVIYLIVNALKLDRLDKKKN